MNEYSLQLDPASVRRIHAMIGAVPTMERYYRSTMNAVVNHIRTEASGNAPVLTGTLRRGIRAQVETAWLGYVGVIRNVPYARRREFGFDGQTDRLGRYYPQDPKDPAKRAHLHYLKRAVESSIPFVQKAYNTSTALAVQEMNRA
jgi:hypothetical protein